MTQSTAPREIQEAIATANAKWMATFRAGDARGMAALYTEDGQFLLPNREPVVGRDALAEAFQGFMATGVKEVRLHGGGEIERHGDIVTEISTCSLIGDDGAELEHGKYIVIWKQEDGAWKLHRDIYNSSVPEPEGEHA